MRKLLFISVGIFVFILSCKKNDNDIKPNQSIPVDTSAQRSYVLISSEGPFMNGTGTITRYNRTSSTLENELFETVNGYPLGNIVQSVEAYNNKVYMVVHNANKLVVTSDSSYKLIAEIDNLNLPRYFIPINETKAYVSCWDDNIVVVDIDNYSVMKSIPVGTGPERMLKYGDKVFVLNIGGFGNDSTISVIDCNSDMVDTTLYVGVRPSGIVFDKNSLIWILCSGSGYNGFPQPGDSPGSLICIDPINYSVISKLTFPNATVHPDKLVINEKKDILYYLYPGGIYKYEVNSNALETLPFIVHSSMFYALGFDHREKLIYASDPLDYTQRGLIYKYDAANGTFVEQFEAGIIPGNFYFN